MGIFDMGLLEILLILAVALIIWGPGKIPEIARTLGKMIYALRKGATDLTTAVTGELNTEEKDNLPPLGANSGDKTKELSEHSDADREEPGSTETTHPRDR